MKIGDVIDLIKSFNDTPTTTQKHQVLFNKNTYINDQVKGSTKEKNKIRTRKDKIMPWMRLYAQPKAFIEIDNAQIPPEWAAEIERK